jgi:regulator of replication initiation timing
MEEENKEKSNRIAILIPWALVGILTVLNGFFIYNYFKTDKKLAKTEEVLYSTTAAKNTLDSLLLITNEELSSYKGQNASLDSLVSQKDNDLKVFADKIKRLLAQDRVSKEDLDKAMDEIDELRYYKKKYLTQIDSLSGQIVNLNKENTRLKGNIDNQKRSNENLSLENAGLKTKVAIGAKLSTSSIAVMGIKIRSNGKEKETMKAKQAEQLKFTFKIGENYVAEKGNKDIYLKIATLDGTTLYSSVTGTTTFQFQGEESLYTQKKTIEYTQEAQDVVVYWAKGSAFLPGKYKADLFSDGFKIGSVDFELK